jgi:hypothetical protein
VGESAGQLQHDGGGIDTGDVGTAARCQTGGCTWATANVDDAVVRRDRGQVGGETADVASADDHRQTG